MHNKISTLEDAQKMYDWFKEMRSTKPVWLDEESKCWHVFRYADVHTVITDYHTFSSERMQQLARRSATATTDNPPPVGRSIIAMDPPQHHQYRSLVSPSFTPRAINRLTGRVIAITQELLDDVRSAGQMDIVTDIAYPLPTIVIAELLGVPTSDRPLFKRWADVLFSRQLSDAEMSGGPDSWKKFSDPFPKWASHQHTHQHDHHECDHQHGSGKHDCCQH